MPKWLKAFIPCILAIVLLFVFAGPPSCLLGNIETRDTLIHSAYLKAQQGDYDGALADLDKAIKRDPNSTLAYYNRGTVRLAQEDYAGAIAAFDKAISLKANDEVTYNNRGLAYEKKGKLDEAIADYQGAIYIEPGYAAAWYHWARVLGKKGDKKGMYEKLKKVIELHEDNRELLKKDEDFEPYRNDPEFTKLIGE
jgi:tetratricopeptide (TPR) repeat protein